jgi:NADH:ubiquinone oxidoreductase subunit 6 (subunit J)
MYLFLTFIVSLIFASCVLVVGVQNPIHSILILILVFFFGSVLLFVLQVEYFALLFMIVYVGAIVVLFLFIVMLLEVKIINVVDRFRDLFSFKNLFLGFLFLEILLFLNEGFFDLIPVLMVSEESFFDSLVETNLYISQNKFLSRSDQI